MLQKTLIFCALVQGTLLLGLWTATEGQLQNRQHLSHTKCSFTFGATLLEDESESWISFWNNKADHIAGRTNDLR